jgi:hypothetical protein
VLLVVEAVGEEEREPVEAWEAVVEEELVLESGGVAGRRLRCRRLEGLELRWRWEVETE